jgi:hypothetical protein
MIWTGLVIAFGAALRFWFAFVLAGTAVTAYSVFTLGQHSGDAGVAFVIGIMFIGIFGAGAAVAHLIAVFVLRRTVAGMKVSHRVVSSAIAAVAVLAVGAVWVQLHPEEGFESPGKILIVLGVVPLVLSVLVVLVVNRFHGPGRSPS